MPGLGKEMNRDPNRPLALLFLVLLFGTLYAACSAQAGVQQTSNLPLVATSVSPITSIVENIGGARIRVEGIIPEGEDSHTFDPAPSVARLLSRADLIILNGLFLEEPTLEMAHANKKEKAVILLLGDNTITRLEWQFDFSFPESDGHPNPHLWPNPQYAFRYAELVQEQLTILDPGGKDYYAKNLSTFKERIDALDKGIIQSVQTIPPNQRKLLTYHDSWAYFARRYGLRVIGAVQPSDFSEPSAREVSGLIDQIKREKVPAVFGSEVFPSKVLEQIAKEGGAKFIDKLRDDDLPGKPGEPRHGYLGLMLENMENMAPALGGNADSLKGFNPGPIFEGISQAVYPQ